MLTIAYLAGAHDRQTLIRRIRELTAERDELRRQLEWATGSEAIEAANRAFNEHPESSFADGEEAIRAAITAALAPE